MLNEIAVALRTLGKRPGYSAAVVLTLATGVGATTLMFSIVDAAMLRPLPFTDADRLVVLTGVAGPQRSPRGASMPEVADWRSLNTTLQDVSLYDEISLNLRAGDDVARVDAEMVNGAYFELLGARPAIGRTFLPDEDLVPDQHAVALISEALWRHRFDADPAILERTIHLNDRVFSIVGVMPQGFAGLSFDTDVWVPSAMVTLTAAPSIVGNRGSRWLLAIGRLRNGVTLARAQEDLTRVAALLEERHPDTNRERGVDVTALRETLVGDTRSTIMALMAAVLLFLAIACANVAGLQLARASSRRRELAVRLALGARRWHLLRQLLTESLVLAVVAGLIGTLAAAWALGMLLSLVPAGALPRYVQPSLAPGIVAITIGVSLLAGALVAILPGIAATRQDLTETTKEGARSAGPGLGSIRRPSTQQVLVVAQMALAMTLLASAGLMLRSLDRQMDVPLGFTPQGVTVARLTLPAARYEAPRRTAFVEELIEHLRGMPGVAAAAVATSLPFTGNSNAAIMIPEGTASADAARRYYRNAVTPEFFASLGLPVLRGRAFTDSDRAGAPLVALVNQSGARAIWGTEDAVGRRFRLDADGPAVEIVGIVADARFRSLTTDLSTPRLEPDVYFPFAQRPARDLEIAVRTADSAQLPMAMLQEKVASVDGALPIYGVQRLEEAVRQQTATARLGSTLLTIFSVGAVLLSAIGLYGLIAYVVSLSRREIGIRIALGADARRVVGLIVGNAMTLVGFGVGLGLLGAIAAGAALQNQLFQTAQVDPATLTIVVVLLISVGILASAIPTRRAVQVDPQAALRSD